MNYGAIEIGTLEPHLVWLSPPRHPRQQPRAATPSRWVNLVQMRARVEMSENRSETMEHLQVHLASASGICSNWRSLLMIVKMLTHASSLPKQ